MPSNTPDSPDAPEPLNPEQRTPHCYGLVLAAGSSRRFGSDKRLHELPDGQRLAIASLRNWSAAISIDGFTALFVVTRGLTTQDDDNENLLTDPLTEYITDADIPVTVIPASQYAQGMGHSLAAAVPVIPPGPLVVGLADMPFVLPDTLKRIVNRLRAADSSAIVRPSFKGQPGNPIGFGSALREELAKCTGDSGARSLVRTSTQNNTIINLPMNDSGVISDIDRPSDLPGVRI